MALTLHDSQIDAFVYLLNRSESDENHFLLLADTNLSPSDINCAAIPERILEFSDDCLDGLRTYQWPGNVRELKGVIDYSVTMATGSLLKQYDLD